MTFYCDPPTNTKPSNNGVAHYVTPDYKVKKNLKSTDIEDVFKGLAKRATEEWSGELSAVEFLMCERNEGGGLFGIEPDYHFFREVLIADGKAIIIAQKEQERIDRLNRSLTL